MASKSALAASVLLALLALGAATTFTTTVTTTALDEEANPRYQQCQQQLQGRRFRSCQQYFQQGRGGPYEDGEEEAVLEMAVENPHRQQEQQQQYLQECCREMKEMDRQQCGCEAIRHAVKQAQQEGGRSYHAGQSEQIYQKARSLPRVCGLREQQCSFRVVLV